MQHGVPSQDHFSKLLRISSVFDHLIIYVYSSKDCGTHKPKQKMVVIKVDWRFTNSTIYKKKPLKNTNKLCTKVGL